MSQRNEIRFVKKARRAPLGPIAPPRPDAPHIRDLDRSDAAMTEIRRRQRWAWSVGAIVALADDTLPDNVIGYVIRSAGPGVPMMLISRIAFEPYDYEALRQTAASELVIEPFPEQPYVVTLTGAPLGETLMAVRDGCEPLPMWRSRGARSDARTIAKRDAWQRARLQVVRRSTPSRGARPRCTAPPLAV